MDDKETRQYYDRPDKRPDLRDSLKVLKDTVLDHSHSLEAEQKALLTIILEQGSTSQQVARLRGEHASTVSRRFRRLMSRLSHRTDDKVPTPIQPLNPLEKTILSGFYLCGLNQSQIAARLGISRYHVRKTLGRFETIGNWQLALGNRQWTILLR